MTVRECVESVNRPLTILELAERTGLDALEVGRQLSRLESAGTVKVQLWPAWTLITKPKTRPRLSPAEKLKRRREREHAAYARRKAAAARESA